MYRFTGGAAVLGVPNQFISRDCCLRGRRRDKPDICLRNQWDVTLFERRNVP
jgi:hypothetical protein